MLLTVDVKHIVETSEESNLSKTGKDMHIIAMWHNIIG